MLNQHSYSAPYEKAKISLPKNCEIFWVEFCADGQRPVTRFFERGGNALNWFNRVKAGIHWGTVTLYKSGAEEKVFGRGKSTAIVLCRIEGQGNAGIISRPVIGKFNCKG